MHSLPDYIFKQKSTFTFYIDYTKELPNHGFCFFRFVIKIILYRERKTKTKTKRKTFEEEKKL